MENIQEEEMKDVLIYVKNKNVTIKQNNEDKTIVDFNCECISIEDKAKFEEIVEFFKKFIK